MTASTSLIQRLSCSRHGMTRSLQRALRLILGMVVLLLPGAVSQGNVRDDLPALGDASSGIISPEVERRIGESFLRSVRAQAPTVADPLLKYYTEYLIYRLVEHSDLQRREVTVVLIDDPQINAFAAPGGIIGINLGLFLHARSVHEFSSVLAHEIAHLSQRHFARGVEESRKQTIPYLAALLASAALMATTGSDAGLAALAGTQSILQNNQLRYSRTREQEADRLGIETMARAGMDPHAMAMMFSQMSRANRFRRTPPEFLLTHPVTQNRITDARNHAAQFEKRFFDDDLTYQFMRTRVRHHFTSNARDAFRAFEAEEETGQTQNIEASRYGKALAATQLRNYFEARSIIRSLIGETPSSLVLRLTRAEILIEAQRTQEAIEVLREEARLQPDNVPVGRLLAKALNQAQQYQQAKNVLFRLSNLRPIDDDIWYELAETAGLAGDVVSVHEARAEFFQLNGRIDNAVQHLDYALELIPRSNFSRFAKVQQRAVDLKRLQREL